MSLKYWARWQEFLMLNVVITSHAIVVMTNDHKRFVKGLKEYLETDWKKLKARLAKCYPPEEEEFSITKKALVKFIQQNQNIHNLVSFDEYCRNFGLLANALEAKKKLKEDERNSLFIHGVPYSLHKKIIDELLCTNDWKNKDIAPEMDKVINAAEELLKIGQFNFKNMNTHNRPRAKRMTFGRLLVIVIIQERKRFPRQSPKCKWTRQSMTSTSIWTVS